jgi:hypothetical protein
LPSIWSFVLIDHTWLGLSGGFAPTSFPLYEGPDVKRLFFGSQHFFSQVISLVRPRRRLSLIPTSPQKASVRRGRQGRAVRAPKACP